MAFALTAATDRAAGADGRAVRFPGAELLVGTVPVADVLARTAIEEVRVLAGGVLPAGAQHWTWLLAILALGNVLVIGLIAIAQRDLKQLIGYSSVMHMGYAFLGVACFSALGSGGVVLMMVAHGLSVALLFLLASSIHQRTHTFDLEEMGGLAQVFTTYNGKWQVSAIRADLPGFTSETRKVFGALAHRISRETTELYPVADEAE